MQAALLKTYALLNNTYFAIALGNVVNLIIIALMKF